MIIQSSELILNIIAVSAIGFASLRIKIIDKTGFIAAMFVGLIVLVFGGLRWFILLLSFHLSAGFFTRYKYERKMKIEAAEVKEGARSWRNILSNGLIASILAIFYGLSLNSMFAAGFLGAISTSVADTLATEIGLLNYSEPRLITNLHMKVRAGISGGVTILGELSALFGSCVIALIALLIGFEGLNVSDILIFTLIVGFLGCNFDSLLGATIQYTSKCKICGKLTEKKMHCENRTEYYKGIRFVDNNVVNFASTIFGVLVSIVLYTNIKLLS